MSNPTITIITIKQVPSGKFRVGMDADKLERLSSALGLYNDEFLESLERSERDQREERYRKINSLKELREVTLATFTLNGTYGKKDHR